MHNIIIINKNNFNHNHNHNNNHNNNVHVLSLQQSYVTWFDDNHLLNETGVPTATENDAAYVPTDTESDSAYAKIVDVIYIVWIQFDREKFFTMKVSIDNSVYNIMQYYIIYNTILFIILYYIHIIQFKSHPTWECIRRVIFEDPRKNVKS